MKISTRLALGFGMTSIIGLGIAGYGAFAMHELSAHASELATNRMVKIAQITAILDNFNTIGRATRDIVISGDAATQESEKKRIIELRAANTELLAKLDKSLSLPKTRELFKVINDNRPAYNAGLDRVIDLTVKGNKAAAAALLFGDVHNLQSVIFKATNDIRTAQQDIADRLATDAAASANIGTGVLLGLALLMTVISSIVGWWLLRGLRLALGAEPIELASAVASVADGNLGQPLPVRAGDSSSVMAGIARMQASLNDVVSTVRGGADSVATASSEIAQGNLDLSQRTEQQASALQQTAATMEELGSTVRTTADNAQQANQLARSASEIAARGGDVVGQVVGTMKGINDSSKKVADIIGVIDSIAFQTNILALNAAVEAARAGEQGRGFAVVASEVRSLAQRSAEAAKEIKALIGASVDQVEQGTLLVDRAGQTMSEIVGAIQRVSDIAGEISAATKEQSSAVSQVGEAVSQMDQVTQQNAALVEQSAAAAESLKVHAQQLVQAVAVFTLANGSAAGATTRAAPRVASHAAKHGANHAPSHTSNHTANHIATPPAAPIERRGPGRAKNVTRPNFTRASAASPDAPRHDASANVGTASGTDDWEAF